MGSPATAMPTGRRRGMLSASARREENYPLAVTTGLASMEDGKEAATPGASIRLDLCWNGRRRVAGPGQRGYVLFSPNPVCHETGCNTGSKSWLALGSRQFLLSRTFRVSRWLRDRPSRRLTSCLLHLATAGPLAATSGTEALLHRRSPSSAHIP